MPANLKAILAAFAILAMGAVQVFGLSQGFVCYCDGEPVQVMTDHCHAEGDGCDSEHSHSHDEDIPDPSSQHLVNELDVTSSVASAGMQIPAAIMAVLPEFFSSDERIVIKEETINSLLEVSMKCGIPPTALTVAQSTVFLI